MKLSFVASTLALLASAALAAPSYKCVSQSEAEQLVSLYGTVIADQPSSIGTPAQTVRAITNVDYMEQSDSANIIIGIPVCIPTITSSLKAI